MIRKLSWRRGLACGAVGVGVFLGYVGLSAWIVSGMWMRGEGDLPPAAPWRVSVEEVVVAFPFGTLGLVQDVLLLPLFNGLFWGALSAALVALWLRSYSRSAAGGSQQLNPAP